MPKLNQNSHSFKNSGKDLRSIPLYFRKTRFADSKILNAVDVVLMVCKRFGMVDVVMDKTADARLVIAAQAIHVNNAVRHDFLFDNRQSIGLGIIYGNDIDPSVRSECEDDNFP